MKQQQKRERHEQMIKQLMKYPILICRDGMDVTPLHTTHWDPVKGVENEGVTNKPNRLFIGSNRVSGSNFD